MKVSTFTNTVVERTGLADDGRFKIAFNAKMAKILADGIYSDKITSIIRELSCNAIDSHVESGQSDMQIEVHLPGIFEPWFHVRDFGVGLDHNQVMNIFTCYGASTKTNSNDFIGQLGLGSKSPFSYVDAFDVTAIKDGVMRQYSMYKSEDGMPSVALLLEQPTKDRNGVTVKIPVMQSDFNNFREKASNVFRWFTPTPRVVGMSDFEVKPVETVYSGTDWMIRRKAGGYYNTHIDQPVALMGRVAYPISADAISSLDRNLKTLLSLPMVLNFNIGDLEIAASREALGYDARTQANIKAKLAVVLTELGAQFEQRMKDAKTRWDACNQFGQIFGYGSDFHYEFETIFGNAGLKWNGTVIKNNHVSINTADIYKTDVTSPPVLTLSGSFKRARKMEYHRSHTVRCMDNTKIIFDDLEKGGASRVNYYHEVNNQNFEITVFGPSKDKTVQEIVDLLGNPPYQFTSQLPKRPAASRTATKIKMLVYDGMFSKGRKPWDPIEVNLEDGGIYVNLKGYDVLQKDDSIYSNWFELIKHARECGILDKSTPIYAPRGSFKKKLEEMPEWENVFDVINRGLDQRLTPVALQNVADVDAFNQDEAEMGRKEFWTTKWDLLDDTGVFGTYVTGMRELERKYRSAVNDKALTMVSQLMGHNHKLPAASYNGVDGWKAVSLRYPLLPMLLNTYYGSDLCRGTNGANIRDYVNLVDASTTLPAKK
jgi:hypothetical protein